MKSGRPASDKQTGPPERTTCKTVIWASRCRKVKLRSFPRKITTGPYSGSGTLCESKTLPATYGMPYGAPQGTQTFECTERLLAEPGFRRQPDTTMLTTTGLTIAAKTSGRARATRTTQTVESGSTPPADSKESVGTEPAESGGRRSLPIEKFTTLEFS